MQTGNDGYEIYKHVGVMHAVVFADRTQDANSAQVMGRLQNFNGLKKRKIAIGTGKGAIGANKMTKLLLLSRLGVEKVEISIECA